jgi:hypothetical protein
VAGGACEVMSPQKKVVLEAMSERYTKLDLAYEMNFLIIKTVNFMELTLSKMNVQAEKLELITWLAQLQDINLLKQLKELRQNEERKAYEASLKPMTVDELVARAEASNRAIEAGEYQSIEEALAELDSEQ